MVKVLVVEDNPATMKLTPTASGNAGISVVGTSEAGSGLVLPRQLRPDLILMDGQLLGVGRLTAAAQLQYYAVTAIVTVIALSAPTTNKQPTQSGLLPA
jgi:CheY-like chemotaxis protein